MAGILAAIKLKEMGCDFVVYEKAGTVGGTWRENTYPGLTCDTPSHSYTYSFEPNPDWSQQLPPGKEIHAYFENIVKKYDLTPFIKFNQEIIHCAFKDGLWHLETRDGIKDKVNVVIAATGVLHHPNYPNIEGLESFEGACFHTSRWDHSVPLDGCRIGIIGNGSTGVQMVSALASRVGNLKHFQRTPQWIMPVENRAFTDEERAEFHRNPLLLQNQKEDPEYLANFELFTNAIVDAESDGIKQIEAFCLQNLEQSIADPELKEKLRPSYRAGCKRLIFSPDYYQAIQHPNADVITDGIECIEPNGVRTQDGKLHELDVLALATGFKSDQFMRPMEVTGRNGITLNQAWEKRPNAYLAISIPNFPNFFMINGPTGPVGNFSLIEIAEMQWGYISQLLQKLRRGDCTEISVNQEAMDHYEDARIAAARKTIFASGCNSWYLDDEGVPATWPWSHKQFSEAMAHPEMSAFELRK